MGELERAKECSAQVLQQKLDFFDTCLRQQAPFKVPADLEHLLAGLRLAGLPE
jgi:hypothetical protein